MVEYITRGTEGLTHGRRVWLILMAALVLAIAFTASRVGVAEPPGWSAESVASETPVVREAPRHWLYPPETITHRDFVRDGEDRKNDWIRGDGY